MSGALTAGGGDGFRPCVVIPTYDNPRTVRAVVEAVRRYVPDVVVVDDGSGPRGRAACEAVAAAGLAHVHHRERNGGKGAAVKSGFAVARELGYTHAVQVDADGQHDAARIPAFLDAARADPEALVLGYPEYDASAPAGRRIARKFTTFWVTLEAGPGRIKDTMIGFRVYPLAQTHGLERTGDHMDFDIEVAVRLAWRGLRIVNLPIKVRYLSEEEGGVSHFQMFWDNARFSWLHTRLCTERVFRLAWRLVSAPARLVAPKRASTAGPG